MNVKAPPPPKAFLVSVFLGSSLALLVWLYGLGLLGIPLVVAQEREAIGGSWEVIHTTSRLGHPSTTRRLIRRRGPFYSTVANYLSSMHYLGDNCISYEASGEEGNSTWAACGFEKPVELYRGFGRAKFKSDLVTIEEFDQGNLVTVRSFTFSEARALALGL